MTCQYWNTLSAFSSLVTGRLFLRGLGMEGREGEGDASDPLESNRDNLEGGMVTDALRDVDGCYNH